MISASIIFFIIGIICIIVAVIIILQIRKKEKRTFYIMNEMLDSAINNSFSETTFDETR